MENCRLRRLARAPEGLPSRVNANGHKRPKRSDGRVEGESHSARMPDPKAGLATHDVVRAIDITHEEGFDSYAFAEMLLKIRTGG